MNSKTLILSWFEKVSIYPPSELFFQAPKSQEKKEKKAKEIFEDIYRFDWEGHDVKDPVGTVRRVVREIDVLDKMSHNLPIPVREELLKNTYAEFCKASKDLVDLLDLTYKKLQTPCPEWYKGWRVSSKDLSQAAGEWLYDISLQQQSKGEFLKMLKNNKEVK